MNVRRPVIETVGNDGAAHHLTLPHRHGHDPRMDAEGGGRTVAETVNRPDVLDGREIASLMRRRLAMSGRWIVRYVDAPDLPGS